MRKLALLAALSLAGLLLLAVGYFSGALVPLPSSYRPAHCDPLTPTSDRKLEAARCIVAWIVSGKPIPGFNENYPDAEIMNSLKRFVVVCPFVAEDAALSADSRVYRVDDQHRKTVYRKYGYKQTDYITLSLIEEGGHSFRIQLSNCYGIDGGHVYSFYFCETKDGLRAKGKCIAFS
jgi:hypothetical protein